MVWRPYEETVGTWIAGSLFATGSSGTSATVLMTHFQTLSSSGGGSIAASPYRDRLCTYTVHPWVGRRQQPELSGASAWRFPLFCRFRREEHLFPQQKVVGRGFFLRASTRPFRSPYYSGDTLRVCLCDTLFLSRRLDLLEARFRNVSA
jgi:hypothetical protein